MNALKTVLLTALIGGFLAGGVTEGISLVQARKGTFLDSTTCTVNVTATKSGDLLVGLVANNGPAPTSVADSVNAFVRNSGSNASFASETSSIWYKANSAAGGTAVTFTWTNPQAGDCFVYEFSGVAAASPVDVSSRVNSGAAANPENGAAITLRDPNGVAIVVIAPSVGLTAGSAPWTWMIGANGNGAAYMIPGNTAIQISSWAGDTTGGMYCSSGAGFIAIPPPIGCN